MFLRNPGDAIALGFGLEPASVADNRRQLCKLWAMDCNKQALARSSGQPNKNGLAILSGTAGYLHR